MGRQLRWFDSHRKPPLLSTALPKTKLSRRTTVARKLGDQAHRCPGNRCGGSWPCLENTLTSDSHHDASLGTTSAPPVKSGSGSICSHPEASLDITHGKRTQLLPNTTDSGQALSPLSTKGGCFVRNKHREGITQQDANHKNETAPPV